MHKPLSAAFLVACVLVAAPGAASAQAAFKDKPHGYFRFDTNLNRSQIWLGGGYPLGDVDLESDLILDGSNLQGDVGVAFYAGALAILPMVGISFDFDRSLRQFDSLVMPRVFTVLEAGPLYLESWLQLTLRDQFLDRALDEFYTRDFVLFVASEYFAIGPQVELRYGLKNGPPKGVVSLPVGGQIATSLAGNRLALFLGYETAGFTRGARSGFTGRFTFVRSWQ